MSLLKIPRMSSVASPPNGLGLECHTRDLKFYTTLHTLARHSVLREEIIPQEKSLWMAAWAKCRIMAMGWIFHNRGWADKGDQWYCGWVVFRNNFCTGCPKKMHPRLFKLISPATNMLEGWDISHLKGGICSSVWSKKHFCKISGNRDINNTIWGIQFQEFEMMNPSDILKSDTTGIYS